MAHRLNYLSLSLAAPFACLFRPLIFGCLTFCLLEFTEGVQTGRKKKENIEYPKATRCFPEGRKLIVNIDQLGKKTYKSKESNWI